jgi:hypothetical protein
MNEIWTYSFKGHESITQGLYYNWGSDMLGFPTLMEQAMNGALRELSLHLDETPPGSPSVPSRPPVRLWQRSPVSCLH